MDLKQAKSVMPLEVLAIFQAEFGIEETMGAMEAMNLAAQFQDYATEARLAPVTLRAGETTLQISMAQDHTPGESEEDSDESYNSEEDCYVISEEDSAKERESTRALKDKFDGMGWTQVFDDEASTSGGSDYDYLLLPEFKDVREFAVRNQIASRERGDSPEDILQKTRLLVVFFSAFTASSGYSPSEDELNTAEILVHEMVTAKDGDAVTRIASAWVEKVRRLTIGVADPPTEILAASSAMAATLTVYGQKLEKAAGARNAAAAAQFKLNNTPVPSEVPWFDVVNDPRQSGKSMHYSTRLSEIPDVSTMFDKTECGIYNWMNIQFHPYACWKQLVKFLHAEDIAEDLRMGSIISRMKQPIGSPKVTLNHLKLPKYHMHLKAYNDTKNFNATKHHFEDAAKGIYNNNPELFRKSMHVLVEKTFDCELGSRKDHRMNDVLCALLPAWNSVSNTELTPDKLNDWLGIIRTLAFKNDRIAVIFVDSIATKINITVNDKVEPIEWWPNWEEELLASSQMYTHATAPLFWVDFWRNNGGLCMQTFAMEVRHSCSKCPRSLFTGTFIKHVAHMIGVYQRRNLIRTAEVRTASFWNVDFGLVPEFHPVITPAVREMIWKSDIPYPLDNESGHWIKVKEKVDAYIKQDDIEEMTAAQLFHQAASLFDSGAAFHAQYEFRRKIESSTVAHVFPSRGEWTSEMLHGAIHDNLNHAQLILNFAQVAAAKAFNAPMKVKVNGMVKKIALFRKEMVETDAMRHTEAIAHLKRERLYRQFHAESEHKRRRECELKVQACAKQITASAIANILSEARARDAALELANQERRAADEADIVAKEANHASMLERLRALNSAGIARRERSLLEREKIAKAEDAAEELVRLAAEVELEKQQRKAQRDLKLQLAKDERELKSVMHKKKMEERAERAQLALDKETAARKKRAEAAAAEAAANKRIASAAAVLSLKAVTKSASNAPASPRSSNSSDASAPSAPWTTAVTAKEASADAEIANKAWAPKVLTKTQERKQPAKKAQHNSKLFSADYAVGLQQSQADSKHHWDNNTGWAAGMKEAWGHFGGAKYINDQIEARRLWDHECAQSHANYQVLKRHHEQHYINLRKQLNDKVILKNANMKASMHELRTRSGVYECVICMSDFNLNTAHIAKQCAHIIGCGSCCRGLSECPICRCKTDFAAIICP